MLKNFSKSAAMGTAALVFALTGLAGCSSEQDQAGTVIMNTAINTDPALTDSSLTLIKKKSLISGETYELTGTLTYLPQYKDRLGEFLKADLKSISKTLDAEADGKSMDITVKGTAGDTTISAVKAVLGKDGDSMSLSDLMGAS